MEGRFALNYISFIPYLANYEGGIVLFYFYHVLNICVPVIIIVSAYFKIFLVVRKQLRTIRPEENEGLTVSSIKAAKNLFVMICVYCMAYIPFFVTYAPVNFPLWFLFAGNWIFYYNATFNPVLYVVLHKSVREEYRKVFCPYLKRSRQRSFATGATLSLRGQTATPACTVSVIRTGD